MSSFMIHMMVIIIVKYVYLGWDSGRSYTVWIILVSHENKMKILSPY